ncbi:hypothetical protein D3C71_1715120 [compost metagenome]
MGCARLFFVVGLALPGRSQSHGDGLRGVEAAVSGHAQLDGALIHDFFVVVALLRAFLFERGDAHLDAQPGGLRLFHWIDPATAAEDEARAQVGVAVLIETRRLDLAGVHGLFEPQFVDGS